MFEGGFLGLDNITVIDRSEPNSDGAVLEQSDATGWMGMFCLNLMRIALELAQREPRLRGNGVEVPPALRLRRVRDEEHGRPRRTSCGTTRTASSTTCCAIPTAASQKFRVRSLVGLIPLFAVERLELEWIEPFKEFTANLNWFLKNRRDLVEHGDPSARAARRQDDATCSRSSTPTQLRRLLGHAYDEREFLSHYGIRCLSKLHEAQPFEFDGRRVAYEPAESTSKAQGRQLELARADLVPDDASSHRIATQARHRVRRATSSRRRARAASPSRFRRWRATSPAG